MSKILILVVIIVLVLVFFRKKVGFSSSGSNKTANAPKDTQKAVEMKQDPICGSYTEESTPYKVKYYDKIFYFCSEECKEKFIEQKKKENQA